MSNEYRGHVTGVDQSQLTWAASTYARMASLLSAQWRGSVSAVGNLQQEFSIVMSMQLEKW